MIEIEIESCQDGSPACLVVWLVGCFACMLATEAPLHALQCSPMQCNAIQRLYFFLFSSPFSFFIFIFIFQSHAGLSYATCPPVLSCPVLSCLFCSITFHVSMYCMYPS